MRYITLNLNDLLFEWLLLFGKRFSTICLIRHIWWHLTLWVLFMLYITLRRTLSESSFDWYTIAYCIWREIFSLRPQSMIKLFRSLLPRSVEKRLMGLRLEIEIGDWDWLRLEKQLAVIKGNDSAQSVLPDRFDGMRHIGVLFMLYITLIWVIYHQSDHLSDTLVEKQFSTICLIWHIWWHETWWVLLMLYITLIWVIYHQSHHVSDTLIWKWISTICLIRHIWWHETYMGVVHARYHPDWSDISSKWSSEWYTHR
jgi:hypothetical protein